MALSPSQVFIERMARFRRRREWSQGDLAEELTRFGVNLNQAQVAKIEGGKRGLSLDEAIAIAWVLGVPPAFLYLPLGESERVSPVPNESIHPDLVRKWVTGEEPATYTNKRSRYREAWFEDMWVWRLYDRLNAAQDAVQVDPEDRANRDALRSVLMEFRRAGLKPPRHPQRLVDQLAEDMRQEEE